MHEAQGLLARPEMGGERRAPKTALRLAGAFSVLLLLFSLVLALTLRALDQIAAAEAEVESLDRAKHAGHYVAFLVREQYIQQARVMLTWDTSHLPRYEEAVESTHQGVEHLLAIAPTPADRARAQHIADLAKEIDVEFRRSVLPLIEKDERSSLLEIHDRIEAKVGEVVGTNRKLSADYEKRSEAAREHAKLVRKDAQSVLVASWGLAFVLALILGFLLLRSVLRPLSVLRKGVVRLGAGDLTSRIEWQKNDEFGELASTFNQMTEALAQHQQERLDAQKLTLLGQVTAGVAHEINNPLGVMLGYLKLIKKDGNPSTERLAAIEEEALQCQRIVQDLLDVVRPQDLSPHRVDLGQLATDVVGRLKEAGVASEVRAVLPDNGSVLAWGDEGRLRQVVDNLVQNAIDASGAGRAVEIVVSAAGGEGRLAVHDAGSGIEKDVRDRIFDPFFTTKAEGTGLGLAISRAIIEAHGGRIIVGDSKWGGAKLEIILPELKEEERRAS